MPRIGLLLLAAMMAFGSASLVLSQEQSSGYRLRPGQRLDVSPPDRPRGARASLSDDPPETQPPAEEPLTAAEPDLAAEQQPEPEGLAEAEMQPEPQAHYQPHYQPQYSPPVSVASVDESLATTTAGAEAPAGENLPLAPRSEKSGRQLARPDTVGTLGPIGTVVGSLVIVLGLFVAVVWVSRRLGPPGSAPLPKEAVELLGRTTISGQHTLQLVRFGGRLLLVALSPHGAATLTEIIDPTEVERLTAICLRQRPGSSSETFQQTIRQLEREPAGRSFVDQRRPASTSAAGRGRAAPRV